MSKYLITLTPVDRFFFGGEYAFSRGDKDFDSKFSSYIIKSNKFPQQTSLLGMLRFLLLKNSDYFENNKIKENCQNEVTGLIGKESFCADNSEEKNDFGKIKEIFPCFIQRKTENGNWENHIPAPKDFGFETVAFKKESFAFFDWENSVKIPQIPDYDAKEGIKSIFMNQENNELMESDIFIEDQRIGINRDIKTGKTEENAFYKQVFYRFTDDFRFAFHADIDINLPEKEIITLGGDSSKFILEAQIDEPGNIEAILENYRQKINFENCHAKIVLLSDACIDRKIIENNCIFNISETVPFRFLKSTIKTKNYCKFSGKDILTRNENKINLYERGSVFYFETEEKLQAFNTELKTTKSNFYKIGYNHFITIKKEENGK